MSDHATVETELKVWGNYNDEATDRTGWPANHIEKVRAGRGQTTTMIDIRILSYYTLYDVFISIWYQK